MCEILTAPLASGSFVIHGASRTHLHTDLPASQVAIARSDADKSEGLAAEEVQRRQMCSSGSLPPFTGGSLCCQMRRQLAAGGSGTAAKPR